MASTQTNVIQQQFRFSVLVNSLGNFTTPEIHINQIPWKIQIRKAKIENRDVINVSLVCCYKGAENEDWSIEAGTKLKLTALIKSEYSIEKTIPISTFDADVTTAEISEFIACDDLFNHEKGFVSRKKVRFSAILSTSSLNKQTESQDFENTSAKFGVIVQDIVKLNEVSSEKIKLCGVWWFVKFKTNPGHLAVHLYSEIKNPDFAWAFNVNFIAKLMPHLTNLEPLELCLKRRFTASYICFGWTKFIEWKKLLDSHNGYCGASKNIFFEISIDVEPRQSFWKTEIGLLKNDSTKMECPICFKSFGDQKVVTTLCGHLFCGDGCIQEAIKNNPRCPMCNAAAVLEHLRVVHLRT